MDCKDAGLPYFARLAADIRDRTETAMPQAHAFKVMELAIQAQAVQWVLDGNDVSGANGISYEAFEGGDYSAIITFNATGCSNTISNIIVTEIENCAIPQGISPGVSAGFNDTLDLRYFNVTKLEIFNRNGTLVYSKNNYSNEWAGQTDDGEELPVGTYFYTMVYEGGTKSKSGWIYINR